MSNTMRALDLVPPSGNQTVEAFKIEGYVCGYCHGEGTLISLHSDEGAVCPVCGGCGKVDAHVTVKWTGHGLMVMI